VIKRTLDISTGPTRLRIENDQLVIERDRMEVGRAPCEDIGVLLIDHHAVTATHAVFTRLLSFGAAVVFCGDDHLPTGILLPVTDNQLTAQRMRVQLAASLPLRKQLWRQIVRAKVRAQADNLPADSPVSRRLRAMSDEVVSGDRTNIEGQAARLYWPALLGQDFRRDPEGPPPNNLLNYGYMVMRAAVARAIVAAGLHPVFSLQHSNRANTFALADDLVEVLRPRVDAVVLRLVQTGRTEIDRSAKTALLGLLAETVIVGDQSGPLMVQLHRVAASLLRCYEGSQKQLDLPTWPASFAQSEDS